MKNIVLLGSSGSIGQSTLKVVKSLPRRLKLTGLAVNRDYKQVLRQAQAFGVKDVAVADPEAAIACARRAPRGIRVHRGPHGVETLAALAGTDITLCAIVGMAGLRPVLSAITHGIDVALATKEVLVAAGRIVTDLCAKHGARLLPVDSEHSAIFQCLNNRSAPQVFDPKSPAAPRDVKRLILTASGGPFAMKSKVNFDKVTVDEALNHPRWNMGRKVTVDSATLMNKGLELMEARWLFNVPDDRLEVVIHPESIVHSMVEFMDNSVLAQLSEPDMRFAIQYALLQPERIDTHLPRLDLTQMGGLHFRLPDIRRFPCLALARQAAADGGTRPAVLNAANEEAVQQFLEGNIAFSGIWHRVESVLSRHPQTRRPDIEDIFEADRWARNAARNPQQH